MSKEHVFLKFFDSLPLYADWNSAWLLRNYQNSSRGRSILILLYTRTPKSVGETARSLKFRHFRSLVRRLTGKILCKLSKSSLKTFAFDIWLVAALQGRLPLQQHQFQPIGEKISRYST